MDIGQPLALAAHLGSPRQGQSAPQHRMGSLSTTCQTSARTLHRGTVPGCQLAGDPTRPPEMGGWRKDWGEPALVTWHLHRWVCGLPSPGNGVDVSSGYGLPPHFPPPWRGVPGDSASDHGAQFALREVSLQADAGGCRWSSPHTGTGHAGLTGAERPPADQPGAWRMLSSGCGTCFKPVASVWRCGHRGPGMTPCQRSLAIHRGATPGLPIPFPASARLSVSQDHTVLAPVALSYILKPGRVSPVLFLFEIAGSVWCPLRFHVDFRVGFSVPQKSSLGF